MENTPKTTPGTTTEFGSEFERKLQKGEAYSAKPTNHAGGSRERVLGEHAENREKQQARRAEWETEEAEMARQEALKEASEQILDPQNVIGLKKQLVSYELTLDSVNGKIVTLSQERKNESHKTFVTPPLEEWKRGWRQQAENDKKQKLAEINKRLEGLHQREDEIDSHIQSRIRNYVEKFDRQGLLSLEGTDPQDPEMYDSASRDAQTAILDELQRMLNLSFPELEKLVKTGEQPEPETTADPYEAENEKTAQSHEELVKEATQRALAYIDEELLPTAPEGSPKRAQVEAMRREIENGNFFDAFQYGHNDEGEQKKIGSESVHDVLRRIVNDRNLASSQEDVRLAEKAELVLEVIEALLKEPDQPDQPDYRAQAREAADASAKAYEAQQYQKRLDEYRLQAEQAAKDSAEAYEKVKWEQHRNKLKAEQETERQRVLKQDKDESDRAEAHRKQLEKKLRESAEIMAEIDAADGIRLRNQRRIALTRIAENKKNQEFYLPDGSKINAGLEAASRLRRSKVRHKFNPGYYLLRHTKQHDMTMRHLVAGTEDATTSNQAAKSITRGWRRFGRGRNQAIFERIETAQSNGQESTADELLGSIKGIGGRIYRDKAIGYLSAERLDLTNLDESIKAAIKKIKTITHPRRRDEAYCLLAVKVSSGDKDRAINIVTRYVNTSKLKTEVLDKISGK